jgi:hypothetical protein
MEGHEGFFSIPRLPAWSFQGLFSCATAFSNPVLVSRKTGNRLRGVSQEGFAKEKNEKL